MSDPTDLIGKHVIAFTAPGDTYAKGIVIGYAQHPTFLIEKDDGTRFSWAAHLTRENDARAHLFFFPPTTKCVWEDCTGFYVTECGESIELGASTNKGDLSFCPFCRRGIFSEEEKL